MVLRIGPTSEHESGYGKTVGTNYKKIDGQLAGLGGAPSCSQAHQANPFDLLKGTRKGKSNVKDMDHIVGVSNLLTRQKAKEQRDRAVTQSKT